LHNQPNHAIFDPSVHLQRTGIFVHIGRVMPRKKSLTDEKVAQPGAVSATTLIVGALFDIMAFTDKAVRDYAAAFSRYYPLVYSAVYSKLNNSDETEDVCQEVFLKFFRKYGEIQNHRSWLYGTLRLVLGEHYRKKRGDLSSSDSEIEGVAVSYVNGFRDTRILLQEAMDRLETGEDGSDRVIFDMVAVNNFTYGEAAKHLGMGEQQVRYRYEKSVKRLLGYLREKGIQSLEDLL